MARTTVPTYSGDYNHTHHHSGIEACERTCCNCRHFDRLPFRAPSWLQDYGVCRIEAVEPDAGQAIVILTGQGHCLNHADAFDASDAFLAELEDTAAEAQDIANTYYNLDRQLQAGAW